MEKDKSIMEILSDLKEYQKKYKDNENISQKDRFSVSDIFDTLRF